MEVPVFLSHANPEFYAARQLEKQKMRAELLAGAFPICENLGRMQGNESLRLRLQLCEASVTRQQRARNPDTLIREQLVSHQRWFSDFFHQHPAELAICRSIDKSLEEVQPNRLDFTEQGNGPHIVRVHSIHRVATALRLASFIALERGFAAVAVQLHVLAIELLQLLEPERPIALMVTSYHKSLAGHSPEPPAERFAYCLANGYHQLSCERPSGALLAFHDEGALFIGTPDDKSYDIDLSLLTEDLTAYPDPRVPVQLKRVTNIAGCRYTDRSGQQREVTYDAEKDTYILVK